MIFFELLAAIMTLGVNQLMQSRYGALGLLCLFLLGVGIKARNTACLSAGVVVFALLMAQG
ncbi:hypothetical protein ACUXZZ_19745 [Streptomyces graminifolii]|uniref:Uncharacterized protein n=1 Tax=Streptomyces sp. R08 TaxID=3238624 RepID=A0AB39MEF1_9ACTN|nr:hypothetical protein [Streptomyces sp. NBC_00252]